MKFFIFSFFLILSFSCFSQNFKEAIDELKGLRVASTTENLENEEILSLNRDFKNNLIELLKTDIWQKEAFDSIPYFARLKSPDKVFDLFCWNTELENGDFKYFALLYHHKQQTITEFIDKSDEIYDVEYKKLSSNKWFGALYYEIIPTKNKNGKYYTVLGWDGHNDFTTKKVIDAFAIDKNGNIKFDQIVFHDEIGRKSRILFEYSEKTSMSLKYNKKAEVIVFDHLAPFQPGAEGIYEFYGPDLSYDGFELKNGEWYFQKYIDARAPNSMDNYIDPRKNPVKLNTPK